jgi:glycerophosphoryl diester phosphodiesterase
MKWLIVIFLSALPGCLLGQAPGCPNFSAAKVMNAARIPQPPSQGQGITVLTAHRGYWEFVPENSTLAVQAAIANCIESAEIDLRLTLDLMPVLQHDISIERTTDGSGYIYDLCYDNFSISCSSSQRTPSYDGFFYKDRFAQIYTDGNGKLPVQTLDDLLNSVMDSNPNLVLVIDSKDTKGYPGKSTTLNSYQTLVKAWKDIKRWEETHSLIRNRIIFKIRIIDLPSDPNQVNQDLGFCTGTGCTIPPGQGIGTGSLTSAVSNFNLVPIWYTNDCSPTTPACTNIVNLLCNYNNYLGGTSTPCGPASPSVKTGYLWNPEVSPNTPGNLFMTPNGIIQSYIQNSGQNITGFVPAADWPEGTSLADGQCCRYRYTMPFTIGQGSYTSPPLPQGVEGPYQYIGDIDYIFSYTHSTWISGDHALDILSYLKMRGQRNTALISQ